MMANSCWKVGVFATLGAMSYANAFGFNITGDSTCRISYVGDRTVITCPQSTTLTVTGSGTAEVLLVGGGGNNSKGVDGLGGGGSGGYGGGSGVVIVRYRYDSGMSILLR